jgi:hypothetical protein
MIQLKPGAGLLLPVGYPSVQGLCPCGFLLLLLVIGRAAVIALTFHGAAMHSVAAGSPLSCNMSNPVGRSP